MFLDAEPEELLQDERQVVEAHLWRKLKEELDRGGIDAAIGFATPLQRFSTEGALRTARAIAEAYVAQGYFMEARRHLEDVIGPVDPLEGDCVTLTYLSLQEGEQEVAKRYLNVLRRMVHSVDVHPAWLALRVWANLDDDDVLIEVLPSLRRLLENDSVRGQYRFLVAVATSYAEERVGETSRAIYALRAFLNGRTSTPKVAEGAQAQVRLAELYAAEGRVDEAGVHLRRAARGRNRIARQAKSMLVDLPRA